MQTLQISTKSTAQFLSNSCLKNSTQNQKFPIWKSRLSSSYTIPSVIVCAESGHHLHRHLHVSCADRTFSAAARLPVCRPCSCVNLPQKSVQCWTRPCSPCQEIPPTTFWHCNPYLLCLKTLISIPSSLVKTIAFYAIQMRHKNVTKIMSFVTLSAVSILIGIFHIGKFCFWVLFFKSCCLETVWRILLIFAMFVPERLWSC